ncbi:MAG: ThuA domain-containing protein [Bryobacteraceae bacterium]
MDTNTRSPFTSLFDDPNLAVTVDGHPAVFQSELRSKFDVLVLYDMVHDFSDEAKRNNLKRFVEAGKGVVVIHHALGDYNQWPYWYEEVTGGRFVAKPDGKLGALQYEHDQKLLVTVEKKHPVTAGLGSFTVQDETYKGMWISPKVEVLLRTNHSLSDGSLAWIGPHRESRVVCIQLGHDQYSHRDANYRKLVLNAIRWTGEKKPQARFGLSKRAGSVSTAQSAWSTPPTATPTIRKGKSKIHRIG